MFKTNFSGHNTILGAQKCLGTRPPNAPVATGLVLCTTKEQLWKETIPRYQIRLTTTVLGSHLSEKLKQNKIYLFRLHVAGMKTIDLHLKSASAHQLLLSRFSNRL